MVFVREKAWQYIPVRDQGGMETMVENNEADCSPGQCIAGHAVRIKTSQKRM